MPCYTALSRHDPSELSAACGRGRGSGRVSVRSVTPTIKVSRPSSRRVRYALRASISGLSVATQPDRAHTRHRTYDNMYKNAQGWYLRVLPGRAVQRGHVHRRAAYIITPLRTQRYPTYPLQQWVSGLWACVLRTAICCMRIIVPGFDCQPGTGHPAAELPPRNAKTTVVASPMMLLVYCRGVAPGASLGRCAKRGCSPPFVDAPIRLLPRAKLS